jgi:signal transduction histidine kinase
MVRLDSVIATSRLAERRREPDHEAENRALVSLASSLASDPDGILQKLVEVALELCRAHSAGLSLVEEENGRLVFRWPAIAGRFAEHVFGKTPREFSPCGVVVDTNAVQLFDRPGRHYTYLDEVEPRIVEALLQPFSVAGRPIGTIWVMAHDQERKFDTEDARTLHSLATFASGAFQLLSATRAAREAEQKKDDFLALLSHEMRNPLQTASSWGTLLEDPRIDAAKKAHGCSVIRRSLAHLTRMVDDLSDVSRIAAQKLSIELEDVDLSPIVRDCVEACESAVSEARVEMDVAIDDAIRVRADPVRMQQIIGNLLSNAIKFTPAGGRISVRAHRVGRRGEVIVSDTGEGISAATLPFVFERFRQGDSSVARRHGGLGLGLAIAKHFVDLHGGTLEAQSDGPGRGSTFRVTLPLLSA